MEVKATIVNMAESKLQTGEYPEWFYKNVAEWGGIDYKFNRDSIMNDLLNLDNNTEARVYSNGISITYLRNAIVEEHYTETDDHEITPNEVAVLYILNDGEVHYINRGFYIGHGYSNYLGINGYEYNTDNIEQGILEKLGKRNTLIEAKNEPNNIVKSVVANGVKLHNEIKEQLMKQKISGLITNVKEAIKKGDYQETVTIFDPETNSLKDNNQKIA